MVDIVNIFPFLIFGMTSPQAQSAYEVKNNFCVFERPFKIKMNGVFLFEISFLVQSALLGWLGG